MGYIPQLYMDFEALSLATSLATRDDWVGHVARFTAAAGWTISVQGAQFTITTNDAMLNFGLFGGAPANDIFWRIIRTDNNTCIHVIDEPSFVNPGYMPQGCGLETVVTGVPNSREATHAGVVLAVLRILSDKNPQILSTTGVSTTFALNSPRNDFSVELQLGASLRSGSTDAQAWAGYVCTSQPSKLKYFRTGLGVQSVGDDNYVSIYLTSKVAGGGNLDNNMVHMAGAKNFLAFAPDTPTLSGEHLATTVGRTTGNGQKSLERMGQLDTFRTLGFCNAHELVLNCESPFNSFVIASALKLFDTREDYAEELKFVSSNFIVFGAEASGVNGFRTHGYVLPQGNSIRCEVNNNVFYGAQSLTRTPQLILFQTSGDAAILPDGVPWTSEISESCDPWVLMSPKGSGLGFKCGQLHVAHTLLEKTVNPTTQLFPWDSQNWMRYTKGGTPGVNIPFTLCFGVTSRFNPLI